MKNYAGIEHRKKNLKDDVWRHAKLQATLINFYIFVPFLYPIF